MSGIFDQVLSYNPTILSSSLAGSVTYKGTWDAATNSPTLANPPAATTKGWYYVVSVAGTQFSLDFAVGDWIISNGSVWQKVDLTDSVSSVFGRTGPVAAQTGDYTAAQITGLGSLATQNGTFSGTSSGTNTGDQTISITGDATASGSTGVLTATVTKINGTSLAGLATGILKNTTTTGVPSIAVAADFPTLNQNTTGTASNVTGTVALANGGTGATNAPDARTALGLGSLATQNGTFSGTSSGTNTGDQTISITGDVTASGSTGALTATVGKINGVALIGLGTGILKNSTVTGQPGIAVAADFPTLNQNTSGTASNVTGVVAVSNGGTGASSLTGYVKGSGTAALTANSTIPNTDVSGLGTMSTQNASSVAITGGSINNTPIGAAVANSGAFTTVTASTPIGTASGGTGVNTTPSNGQVLIGNGTGYTANTLTAGSGISITNTAGGINIEATGGTATEIVTATVTNAESTTITKGQVVYAFGAMGNRMSVKLAYNTLDATSAKTIGVVSDASIAANGTGTITLFGEVTGLALGSYADGDTLYLGATPGSVTSTKPYAPNHLVYVGIVERANNGNGELYVKIQNGYELDELHDVQITSAPDSGALLVRDATNSLWKAARLTAGTNIAITNADASVTVGITGVIAGTNGGTGVNNGANTITIAGNVTHAGAFTQTFTATANTSLTLPVTGTLATLAGSEALSNKTITASAFNGTVGATTANTGVFTTITGTGLLDVSTASASGTNVTLATLRQNYAGTAGHEGFLNFTNISGTSIGKIGTRAVDGNNTSFVIRNFVSGALADAAVFTSTGLNSTAIGATTASTGAFTTLSATGTITSNPASGDNVNFQNGAGVSLGKVFNDVGFFNFQGSANVSGTRIEHPTQVQHRINGATVTTTTSTGLAVTGAVSGSAPSAGATTFTATSNGVSGINHPLYTFQRSGGAVAGEITYEGVGATMNLWTTTAHNLVLGYNRTAIAAISSTGLAVTGVSSATSTGGGAGFSIVRTGGAPSTFTMLNSGGEIIHEYNAVGYGFNISTARVASISSTGLAVTGALSATTGAAFATSSGSVGIGTTSFAGSAKFQVAGGRSYFGSNSSLYAICAAYNDTRAQAGQGYYLGSTDSATPDLAFSNTDGTERVRITYAGNVGIGTTSPGTTLDVQAANASLRVYGTGATDTPQFQLRNGSQIWQQIVDGADSNKWKLRTGAGLTALTCDTSGNLLVGTTSRIGGVDAPIHAYANGGSTIIAQQVSITADNLSLWNSASSGNQVFAGFYTDNPSSLRGSITYNRGTGLVVYGTTSDYRAKDILGPVVNSGALIDAVPVYMGKMKGATLERPMFIAHETPAYAHTGEKDAVDAEGKPVYQQIDTSTLVPVLWAEIQALRQRVAALESN